jgi:hypothetical protein
MKWEELKKYIYHADGSLRDIYIRDVTTDDWKHWVEYVNANYPVEFKVESRQNSNKIDFAAVAAYWQENKKECPQQAFS